MSERDDEEWDARMTAGREGEMLEDGGVLRDGWVDYGNGGRRRPVIGADGETLEE